MIDTHTCINSIVDSPNDSLRQIWPDIFNNILITTSPSIPLPPPQVAAFLTAPFDVVKTHKQIEFGEKVLYAEKPVKALPKIGTIEILRKIFRENGIRGIFAGVVPRVVKVAPACAIMITSFEYGKAFFFRQNVDVYVQMHGSISWAIEFIQTRCVSDDHMCKNARF